MFNNNKNYKYLYVTFAHEDTTQIYHLVGNSLDLKDSVISTPVTTGIHKAYNVGCAGDNKNAVRRGSTMAGNTWAVYDMKK